MTAIPFLGDIDLGNRQVQNHVLHLVGADGTGVEGLIKYRSDLHRGRLHDGTSWRSIAFADEIAGALTFNDTTRIDLTNTAGTITADLIAGSVSNTYLAQMPANTIKGNITGATAATADVTKANLITWLALDHTAISDFDTAVRASRLDQMQAPSAAVSMGGQKITNLADGTSATDAATFGQVNAILQGQTKKDPVKVATTGNITLSGTQTIDGVAVVAGDRVLVKDQTTASANGIYVVAAGAWARAADMDAAAEFLNSTVLVQQGTTGQGDIYTESATVATVGTSTVTFVKTGEGNTVYGADGSTLQLTGTTFSVKAAGITATELAGSIAGNGLAGGAGTALSVNTDGTTIEISGDALRIAATAAGNGLTGGGASALAVNVGTGLLITSDQVVPDFTKIAGKYAADVGDGTTTNISVAHGLGTSDVEVEVWRKSDGTRVVVPWSVALTTPFAVTLKFDSAPTAAQYRVVVHA